MTKLTALIVDDEDLARSLIREYLRAHPDIDIVGECRNGLEAVDAIEAKAPDLVFLDIQMPKLSGLEVLDATARRAGVIFTTAYDEYALQAFDRLAVDYLLKPFSQKRFDEALVRARRLLHQAAPSIESVNALVLRGGQALERIVVRDRNQVHLVPVADIDYVEAQDDYVSIHTAQKAYLKTQALSELETQLDPRKFVRVHRSYLINLDKLASLERPTKDTQVAVLTNGKQVPVSRAGQDRIKAYLSQG